jgi:putative hydrolase of the HAD superfamily
MDIEKFQGCSAILLDFGGTLDSDGEHWLDRTYDLYREAGLDIPPAEIKRVFYAVDDLCCKDPAVNTMGLRQLMECHIRRQFHLLGMEDTHREREMIESFCSRTERYLQRNTRILSHLGNRFRLGVVSNFYGNVEVLCEAAGFSASLDVILDSIRLGIGKPDPEIFRTALRMLDTAPEKTIFVGDSYERDMIPARNIGLKTIWLKGPNPRKPENAGPVDAVIASLSELEALVS